MSWSRQVKGRGEREEALFDAALNSVDTDANVYVAANVDNDGEWETEEDVVFVFLGERLTDLVEHASIVVAMVLVLKPLVMMVIELEI